MIFTQAKIKCKLCHSEFYTAKEYLVHAVFETLDKEKSVAAAWHAIQLELGEQEPIKNNIAPEGPTDFIEK